MGILAVASMVITWPTGLSPRVSTGTANVRLPD